MLPSGDPRARTTDAVLPRLGTGRGPDTEPGPGATLPVSIMIMTKKGYFLSVLISAFQNNNNFKRELVHSHKFGIDLPHNI